MNEFMIYMTVYDALVAGYVTFTSSGDYRLDRDKYLLELQMGRLYGPLEMWKEDDESTK